MDHLIAGIASTIAGAVEGANTQYMEKVAEELSKSAELFAEKMREVYEDEEAEQIVGHFKEIMGDSMELLTKTWEKVIPEEMKVGSPKGSPKKSPRPRKAGQTTAWLEFSKTKREEMKNDGLSFAELGKAVGELWGELSDEDKEGWKEQAVRVNEANANAPKCDWIFRKGKNKDAVCGCVATIVDDDVVRCKKHINSKKPEAQPAVQPEVVQSDSDEGDEIVEIVDYSTVPVPTVPVPNRGRRGQQAQIQNDPTLPPTNEALAETLDLVSAPLDTGDMGGYSTDDTIQAEEEDDRFCEFELKGGPNKGKPCGKTSAVSGGNRCKRHMGK